MTKEQGRVNILFPVEVFIKSAPAIMQIGIPARHCRFKLTCRQNRFDVRFSAGFSEQLHFGVKSLPILVQDMSPTDHNIDFYCPSATLSISAMRSFSDERPAGNQLIPPRQGFDFLIRQQQQQEPFRDMHQTAPVVSVSIPRDFARSARNGCALWRIIFARPRYRHPITSSNRCRKWRAPAKRPGILFNASARFRVAARRSIADWFAWVT